MGRADQAHVAAQDIPELREFVEAETTQEAPDRRHARVVAELVAALPLGAGLGMPRQVLGKDRVSGADHGSELPHAERAAVAAETGLAVEGGSA